MWAVVKRWREVANICAQAVSQAGSEFVGALALLTEEI